MKLPGVYSVLITFLPLVSFAQQTNWTEAEKANYKNIRSIVEYYAHKDYDSTQRELVFERFVYFDNILSDTSVSRIQSRLPKFDAFFGLLLRFVDSVGLDHLDAMPTRFFSKHQPYFRPFQPGENLHALLPMCLTYFDKRRPDQPLGSLVFEEKTNKIYAWIVLCQGEDYCYFLTFDLL